VARTLERIHSQLIAKEAAEGEAEVETVKIPMDLFMSAFTPDPAK
jgi:hypothetical protein